jgi:activator of HSP90 ATPase
MSNWAHDRIKSLFGGFELALGGGDVKASITNVSKVEGDVIYSSSYHITILIILSISIS